MENFMSTKSERVTILTTPEFKILLNNKAKVMKMSVSEFIRMKCSDEDVLSDDDVLLSNLIEQCNKSAVKANQALERSHATHSKYMKMIAGLRVSV